MNPILTLSSLEIAATAEEGRLTAEGGFDSTTAELTIGLGGNAEIPDKSSLTRLLHALHSEAERLQAKHVVMDFRTLKFMNSSCFKEFVTWLSKVMRMPEPSRYRITFVNNPGIRWQRGSLSALSTFAPTIITIRS